MFIKDDYIQLDTTEYDALQDVLQSQRRNDKVGLEFVLKPQKAVRVQPYHWSVAEYYHWLKDKDSESYPHYFGIAYGVYPRVVKLTKYDPEYLEKLAQETEGSYWQIHENNSLSLLFNKAEDAKRVADYLLAYNMRKYVEVRKKEIEAKLASSNEVAEKLAVSNTLDDMLGYTKQQLAQTKPTPYASTYAVGKISLADLVANEVIHTNENGGKQSYTPAAFDLLPAEAIATIAVVLGHGANKYGANNWRKIPVHDHINHALQHLFAYLSCPNEDDLSHAATRLLFALELYKLAAKHPQETTLQPSSKDATT